MKTRRIRLGAGALLLVAVALAGVFVSLRPDDSKDGLPSRGSERPTTVDLAQTGAASSRNAPSSPQTDARSGAETLLARQASPLTPETIAALGRQLREGKDSFDGQKAFERLLAGLTVENAEAIQKELMHLSPHDGRFRRFYHAWGKIGGQNAVETAAGTSKHAGRSAIAGWASEDPEGAHKFFDSLELRGRNQDGSVNHVTQDDLRLGLAHGLGEADPNLAAAFITGQFYAKLVGHKEVGSMIRGVTQHMAGVEGLAAASEWAVMVDHPLRAEAIAGVARTYAADDPHLAIEWLRSIEGKGLLGAAYYHTFDTWMREEPAQATEYISNMADSRARNEAISALVQRTIGENAELALGWAENITEDSFRHRKFRDAFNTWAHHDPEQASTYLTEMPSSPERDYAIQGFASTLVKEDPASAIAWASAVGDLRMRDAALTWVGMAYLENDPAAATAWLPNSGLSAEMVERLLQPPPEDRHLWRFLTHQ